MGMKWVVLCTLWAARLVRQPSAPVLVSNGWLRGSVAPDGSHIRYTGVPYAIGARFQAPRPVKKWNGVFDAFEEHIKCFQRFTGTWITGYENCLTLNVYTPVRISTKPYPVMVFIHGGGFRDGSASPFLYGPEYLVQHDVILVTINYRLEILGFLCLGIKEAPGNVGLKDQVEALHWIKKNIRVLGGDPDNVTLFGVSAGAASVLYHIVSPMSSGLFHKAIMQSGSAISPWSMQFEPLKTASLLAKEMGHITTDPYDLYDLFKGKTAKELLSTRVPRSKGDIILSENIFVPCIERIIDNNEQFMTDSPYNLISNNQFNKVPVIIGYNDAEGYMFVGKENDTTISNFNFIGSMPRDLSISSEVVKREIGKELRELYFGKDDPKTSLDKLSKYEGDVCITFPVINTIELLLKYLDKPIYSYKFCRDGWMNLIKILFGFARYPGATHADDIFYIFKSELTLPMEFLEKDVVNKMTTMWTNFAKFSNPTPKETEPLMKWRLTDRQDPHVLIINRQISTEPLWNDEAMIYWNKTYTKYRRKV